MKLNRISDGNRTTRAIIFYSLFKITFNSNISAVYAMANNTVFHFTDNTTHRKDSLVICSIEFTIRNCSCI